LFESWGLGDGSVSDGAWSGESLTQAFIMNGVGNEGLDEVEKGREGRFIDIIGVSGVAVHRTLMAENVVPVVTIFTTVTDLPLLLPQHFMCELHPLHQFTGILVYRVV